MSKKNKQLVHLLTEAGEALQKDPTAIPWNTYPRPQMKRESFFCLNGEWEIEIDEEAPCPIRVPFCPESLLSGLCIPPADCITLDYRKTFTLPEGFSGDRNRVILHFGAVDQVAAVYLNGQRLGSHEGGYEAFSFDITQHVQAINQLTVEVFDDLRPCHTFPYGKQIGRAHV